MIKREIIHEIILGIATRVCNGRLNLGPETHDNEFGNENIWYLTELYKMNNSFILLFIFFQLSLYYGTLTQASSSTQRNPLTLKNIYHLPDSEIYLGVKSMHPPNPISVALRGYSLTSN